MNSIYTYVWHCSECYICLSGTGEPSCIFSHCYVLLAGEHVNKLMVCWCFSFPILYYYISLDKIKLTLSLLPTRWQHILGMYSNLWNYTLIIVMNKYIDTNLFTFLMKHTFYMQKMDISLFIWELFPQGV